MIPRYTFQYDYNRLYDLYYKTGLKPDQMRVASPFKDYAKDSLNLYRVIDPQIWVKLIGRVRGANFGAIYGKTKAMGYKNITLPEGHTWESYTRFLLATLPSRLRQNYIKKFKTSIEFWLTVGGGLEEETIRELEEHGYNIRRNGVSNYTVMKNSRIVFIGKIPDHTDDIKSTGMPLKEIKQYIEWCVEGMPTVPQRYELFLERKAIVEEQIAQMQKILATINYKCDFYKKAIETGKVDICESERQLLAQKILDGTL